MSDSNELVRIHEAEIVEDMPYIPPSPGNNSYEQPGVGLQFADLRFEGRPRHKSDELRREERHKAKCEDAAMVRERKIAVQSSYRNKQNPMVEFYNDLIEKLAVEIEESE